MEVKGDYSLAELLYKSRNTAVYRATFRDGSPVILKSLLSEHLSTTEETHFNREFEIASQLDIDGVVQVLGLERHMNRLVMVLEDFGGESLERLKPWSSSDFKLKEFLELAIETTGILDELHRRRIIHNDINPSNIIWNRETHQVKLIDFGLASLCRQETVRYTVPGAVKGSLAYISPEQTGKMDHPVDHRSDLYSLGVTLYELATSRLPFASQDPLELIHSHLARKPVEPHECKPDIVPMVSKIIMKLLAKNVEDRYQSASGLLSDLE